MSYHEEQETLENLKAWWAQWGNSVTWLVLVVALAAAGWNGWQYWQRRQTTAAVVLYEQVQQAVSTGDKAMIARIGSDLEDKFGSTPYAQMGGLLAAKGLYAANDTAGAKAQLDWVIQHAKDAEFKQIAQLRLAGILLDEKSYDAGLKLVSDPESDAYKGLFADRRGDLLAAQGKRDEARQAYQGALTALASSEPSQRQLIQFKLDALGG
jgi:predicted negative regulator of RcsB-dependent stress response